MRRAALLVCLALLLAGCNGPLGGGGTPMPQSTATATPTPPSDGSTTPTATPAPDPADVGLAADGVVDAAALARAHHRRLGETSYTLGEAVVVRASNGSVVYRSQRVVRAAAGGDQFDWNGSAAATAATAGTPAWVRRVFDTPGVTLAYSNESATIVAVTVDDFSDAYYTTGSQEQKLFLQIHGSLTADDVVRETFEGVGTRVTAIERDGDTVVYELAASDDDHAFALTGVPNATTEVLSLSATVQRSGIVRQLSFRYRVDTENGTYVVRRVLTVRDVGRTTVERPAWVATVLANESDGRVGRTDAGISLDNQTTPTRTVTNGTTETDAPD
jgi:hypothetical protein